MHHHHCHHHLFQQRTCTVCTQINPYERIFSIFNASEKTAYIYDWNKCIQKMNEKKHNLNFLELTMKQK